MSRKQRSGRITTVAGTTGAGKSEWTAQQIDNDRRVLVWDAAKCEWGNDRRFRCRPVRSLRELHACCLPDAPAERIAYQGPCTREEFELFCRLAWVWCRAAPGALVVDELSDVTSPGKAPHAWGDICRKSRASGTMVYALTQRPSESDKTSLGNSAVIHCGMLAFASDCRYMANCLRVPVEQVEALGEFEWIERDIRAQTVKAGGGFQSKKLRKIARRSPL